MQWSDIRQAHPNQWLVIEALEAHSDGNHRLLDRIAVIEICSDGSTAMNGYRRLHQEHPARELYFVHTSRESLEIEERPLVGIRRSYAASSEG